MRVLATQLAVYIKAMIKVIVQYIMEQLWISSAIKIKGVCSIRVFTFCYKRDYEEIIEGRVKERGLKYNCLRWIVVRVVGDFIE